MDNPKSPAKEYQECPCCCSEILKQAKKCRYCHEWIEAHDQEIRSAQEPIEFDAPNVTADPLAEFEQKQSFQSILVQRLPFHYAISYLLIAALAFVVIQVLWSFAGEDKTYLLSFVFYGLMMTICSAGIVWFESLVSKLYEEMPYITSLSNEESKAFFERAVQNIFSKKYSIFCGLLFGTIAAAGDCFLNFDLFKTKLGMISFFFYQFFFSFWGGAAIYSAVCFGFFIRKFGESDFLKLSLIHSPNSGIRVLGSIHLKTATVAITPYLFGFAARMVGDWSWHVMAILWYGFFGIILMLYLFWPILNIHNLLLREKTKRLRKIYADIDMWVGNATDDSSSENLIRVKELMELETKIKGINSWPFDAKNLIGVLSAVILPLVFMVIEKVILK